MFSLFKSGKILLASVVWRVACNNQTYVGGVMNGNGGNESGEVEGGLNQKMAMVNETNLKKMLLWPEDRFDPEGGDINGDWTQPEDAAMNGVWTRPENDGLKFHGRVLEGQDSCSSHDDCGCGQYCYDEQGSQGCDTASKCCDLHDAIDGLCPAQSNCLSNEMHLEDEECADDWSVHNSRCCAFLCQEGKLEDNSDDNTDGSKDDNTEGSKDDNTEGSKDDNSDDNTEGSKDDNSDSNKDDNSEECPSSAFLYSFLSYIVTREMLPWLIARRRGAQNQAIPANPVFPAAIPVNNV